MARVFKCRARYLGRNENKVTGKWKKRCDPDSNKLEHIVQF